MNRTYTVKDLAKLAGVSIRTLHHYDQIGLLKPAFTAANGYRQYGQDELLRLQQILIHRELDIPLARITELLDAQGPDRIVTLQNQRDHLAAQAKRYDGLIRTIERTIAHLTGEQDMQDKDLYSGIVSPEKQKGYEAWLEDKYGDKAKGWIADGKKAIARMTDAGRAASMAELKEIETPLVEKLKAGVAADSADLDPLIARHRDWVAKGWGRVCPAAAYANLAEMYQHPDFRARYEALAPGFTDYLVVAMKAWASRQT